MKSTGVVRNTDELGRVVIPKELRRSLEIKEKDPLEIFVDNEKVVLQKYKAMKECMVTGKIKESNMTLADGKITLSQEGMDQLLQEIKNKSS
ncbi:AbrB/MazE/SpoVT family DNA-binding domain-containing protein [Gracilibacillus caseinilyticus]|uniref:AbrB/MazE/SpoVT family DNA-binding domain-containing protein n=1 Tax=Gracilibacillus caseinilyticus TaxID=2932256 RepID=A0ABY4EVZ4_9BACI|nr:AbrB/MazE/SpoVT family DNA-binding domain-containing protein [Gracilibacillus caseinilyticus]UOQ48435.1 AbrB/MazE/SpoVT family DNA-binding domain-containing protein [Gracilibacillus caseinilyticus]